jgi:uncharacterized protein YfaS (alpha-2-macroglobulin family)
MTAHVLVALAQAVMAGVEVDTDMLWQGRHALRRLLPRLERRRDDMAYALYALSAVDRAMQPSAVIEDETMRRYAADLFAARDRLQDYSRALLALYLARAGHADRARRVLVHLDNTATADPEYGTVHWGQRRGYWRRAVGAIEATAFALRAYGEIAPDHPHHAGAARWLVVNRKASRWDNTRATAHAIYALTDYAVRSGELDADYTLVATAGSEEIARLRVEAASIIDAGGQFSIPNELLRTDDLRVELRLEGRGVCYAMLTVETFTGTENPAPTRQYLAVRRELVRLRSIRTLGGDRLIVEEPLEDGDTIESGERCRVRLHLTASNDLEFLAIEDPRIAGAEPVDPLSGRFWSGVLSGRREVRDDRVVFFLSALGEGEHQIDYELRAESPGTYHVMPARAYAMYVPEVHGTSAEHHAVIEDGEVVDGKAVDREAEDGEAVDREAEDREAEPRGAR